MFHVEQFKKIILYVPRGTIVFYINLVTKKQQTKNSLLF